MDKYKRMILERYNDKDFAKRYYEKSRLGLKNYEKILVKKFLSSARKILVVGCGCGREIIPLAKLGKEIVAFDISKEMVKYARKLCYEKKVNAEIFVADASSFNSKEKFDAVLMLNCVLDQIYGKKKREVVINNVWKVLKPNGICIAVSNNALYPGKNFVFYLEHLIYLLKGKRGYFDRVYEESGKKVYVHLFTPWQLKSLFSRKFKNVEITSEKSLKGAKICKYLSPILIAVAKKQC